MDKALWQKHLALARTHVDQGRRLVADQISVLDELRRDGHSTDLACRTLRNYEELLDLHIADCQRLEADLANTGKA